MGLGVSCRSEYILRPLYEVLHETLESINFINSQKRTFKFYAKVHAILFFCIDVGTIVLVALVLDENKDNLSNLQKDQLVAHYVIGCIFLAFMILQHIMGAYLEWMIEDFIIKGD